MNLYKVSAARNTLDLLATTLLKRFEHDPLGLNQGKIYLPTKRAIINLRQAFFDNMKEKTSFLLPEIVSLGDAVEEQDRVLSALQGDGAGFDLSVVPMNAQRLILAKLLYQSKRFYVSHKQFLTMANELGKLLDELAIARKDITDLQKLDIESQYAKHWQRNLDFLQDILLRQWPKILAQMAMQDRMGFVNDALAIETQKIRAVKQGESWFLAFGSTGSRPAVADFLHALMKHPNGEVVLPDLQTALGGAFNQAILQDVTHPQYVMVKNLSDWQIEPSAVPEWAETRDANLVAKQQLTSDAVQQAMRPKGISQSTDKETGLGVGLGALGAIRLIECDHQGQEAPVIAMILREALAQNKKAILVTADNILADRVQQVLKHHYAIHVGQSQGRRLSHAPAGRYLLLLSDAWQNQFAKPSEFLQLLQHPFSCFGQTRQQVLQKIRVLQKKARRQIGQIYEDSRDDFSASMMKAFPHAFREGGQRVRGAQIRPLQEWVKDFIALAQLQSLEKGKDTEGQGGQAKCFSGADGRAAEKLLNELLAFGKHYPAIHHEAFVEILRFFIAQEIYRPQSDYHPDIQILGSWESRMAYADRVVIGGLSEGVWPNKNQEDLWFNRSMRAELGLPMPEMRVGLSAHDFVQNLQKPEIFLTRSKQIQSAIALESRFLTRLKVAFPAWAEFELQLGGQSEIWRQWARGLLAGVEDMPQIKRPEPKPDIKLVPKKLSVTRLELLKRDPYSIYGKEILRLSPLTQFFDGQDASLFGSLVHKILENMPEKQSEIETIAKQIIGQNIQGAGRQFLEFVRIKNILQICVEYFSGDDKGAKYYHELLGNVVFQTPEGHEVQINGKADLIAKLQGQIKIIDYKTGAISSKNERSDFLSPQLPILANILLKNGFENMPETTPPSEIALFYWQLKSRASTSKQDKFSDDDGVMIRDYLQKYLEIWDGFLSGRTAFAAIPDPDIEPKYNSYAHLARHKEWRG